ncbi:MAG: hypothetical protein LC659_12680, partial [Myxococcales bacterium]|nr:hypothetical protein [Myxococcales bacterium]
MRPPRALAARGALLGASGGVAAALVDFALAAARANAFLPAGRWKLALFLCGLYGAAGAIALAAAGLVLGVVFWASDGGALWRAAFKDEESRGARWAAYVVAGAGSLALVGAAVDAIALGALRFFHHRALIGALVGAAAAGLALPAALTTLVAAAALSPIIRIGPRARLKYAAPAGIEAATWILGLYAAAGAIAALVFELEKRPRMLPQQKALDVALWTPVILAACLAVAHAIGRRLPLRDRALKTPRGALVSIATALAAPIALVVIAEWQLVRQLDLRPFTAIAVALGGVVALLWADLGAPLRKQPLWQRALVTV